MLESDSKPFGITHESMISTEQETTLAAEPYQHFSLALIVNHACNLRCTYCYTGAKFSAPMPFKTGTVAISRGLRSLVPGGKLHLGFFGGEPLLEAALITRWMRYAR